MIWLPSGPGTVFKGEGSDFVQDRPLHEHKFLSDPCIAHLHHLEVLIYCIF